MKRLARLAAIALLVAGCHREPIKVTNPNYLVLRPLSAEASDGATSASIYSQTVYFKTTDRVIDLSHLNAARVGRARYTPDDTTPHYDILLSTSPAGARLLHDWTSTHIGQQVGIFLDGRLVMAPRVQSAIDSEIMIAGDFTKQQAEDIVAAIRTGGGR